MALGVFSETSVAWTRWLNSTGIHFPHWLPPMNNTCTVFSKVNLKHAFQHVCVDESSQEKTAIITTLGLYKFICMPYGLENPAQCIQRNVHQLLSDLPFVHFVYLDDVIVGTDNKEDQIRDMRCLFQRMKDAGLLVNNNKCVLDRSSIKFLGHIVDSQLGSQFRRIGLATSNGFHDRKPRKNWSVYWEYVPSFTVSCLRHPAKWHHWRDWRTSAVKRNSTKRGFRSMIKRLQTWKPVSRAPLNSFTLMHLDALTEIWCDTSNIAVGPFLFNSNTEYLETAELLEQATQQRIAQLFGHWSRTARRIIRCRNVHFVSRRYAYCRSNRPQTSCWFRYQEGWHSASDPAAPFTTKYRAVCGPTALPEGRKEWHRRCVVSCAIAVQIKSQ